MFWDGVGQQAGGLSGGGIEALASPPSAAVQERRTRLKIGLALGGGAARGWSHIGVMRTLIQAGIVPDVIAGCSVGAVVGGCYAADKLDEVEAFARSLTKRRVMGLLDFHMSGSGLIAGGRLKRLLDQDLGGQRVETLPLRFVTIATERGTVIQSHGGDAVDEIAEAVVEGAPRRWALFGQGRPSDRPVPQAPGITAVMIDAFNITQDRIARSRLAGDPPDVMIAPKLSAIGLFEFHRAAESIDLGRQATERVLPDIMEMIQDAAATVA